MELGVSTGTDLPTIRTNQNIIIMLYLMNHNIMPNFGQTGAHKATRQNSYYPHPHIDILGEAYRV